MCTDFCERAMWRHIWNACNNADSKQPWCSQVICHQGRQTAHALRLSLHGGFFSFASPLDGARQDPNAFAGLKMNSWIWHLQDKTAPRCVDSQKLIQYTFDSLWWQVYSCRTGNCNQPCSTLTWSAAWWLVTSRVLSPQSGALLQQDEFAIAAPERKRGNGE